eukprot:7615-Heterococcus_DN1.PRE.1
MDRQVLLRAVCLLYINYLAAASVRTLPALALPSLAVRHAGYSRCLSRCALYEHYPQYCEQ